MCSLHCHLTAWAEHTSSRLQKQTDKSHVSFFHLLRIKSPFCLHFTLRSAANQKFRDPWSDLWPAWPLFWLKLSCKRQSYFKSPAAACPVLPIPLSGNIGVIDLLPWSPPVPPTHLHLQLPLSPLSEKPQSVSTLQLSPSNGIADLLWGNKISVWKKISGKKV